MSARYVSAGTYGARATSIQYGDLARGPDLRDGLGADGRAGRLGALQHGLVGPRPRTTAGPGWTRRRGAGRPTTTGAGATWTATGRWAPGPRDRAARTTRPRSWRSSASPAASSVGAGRPRAWAGWRSAGASRSCPGGARRGAASRDRLARLGRPARREQRGRHNTTVVNVQNITVYRNAVVPHAVVAVDRARFGHGPITGARIVQVDGQRLRPLPGAPQISATPASFTPTLAHGVRPPEGILKRSVIATRPAHREARRRRRERRAGRVAGGVHASAASCRDQARAAGAGRPGPAPAFRPWRPRNGGAPDGRPEGAARAAPTSYDSVGPAFQRPGRRGDAGGPAARGRAGRAPARRSHRASRPSRRRPCGRVRTWGNPGTLRVGRSPVTRPPTGAAPSAARQVNAPPASPKGRMAPPPAVRQAPGHARYARPRGDRVRAPARRKRYPDGHGLFGRSSDSSRAPA